MGEFLILIGAFSAPVVRPAGVYGHRGDRRDSFGRHMLWMFQRVNYGPVTNAKNRGLRDLSVREWFVIAPVCAVAIFMGVMPGVFLRPMEASVKKVVEHIIKPGPANASAPKISPEPVARVVRPN